MPFKSMAQERWAHTPEGEKALGSKLAEFDSASKGLTLPERVGKPKAKRNPSRRPQGKRSAAGYVPLTDLGM
jgi:hypothetical protein